MICLLVFLILFWFLIVKAILCTQYYYSFFLSHKIPYRGFGVVLSIEKEQEICHTMDYNMPLLQEIRLAVNQLSKPGSNSIQRLDAVCC